MNVTDTVNIYDYLDAKVFLRDLYKFRKQKDPSFTYRRIAEAAGMKSPGHLVNVLRGSDKIAVNKIRKLAEAFSLKKRETEYFANLVHYSRARTHSLKKQYFDQIISLKKNKVKNLDLSQYEYFREWYYIAIHQLLDFHVFKDNYAELAKMLVPEITPAQARKAVRVLEKINLIHKNPEGYYVKSQSTVTTGAWKSMAVTDFQLATMDLAKQSVEKTPRERRSLSTMTVSISEETMDRIRTEIKAMRAKIAEMAREDDHANSVYQINFHAFPMTKADG